MPKLTASFYQRYLSQMFPRTKKVFSQKRPGLSLHQAPWDTRILKIPSAKIGNFFFKASEPEQTASLITEKVKKEKYRFVLCRLDTRHHKLIKSLNKMGWIKVDTLNIYLKKIQNTSLPSPDISPYSISYAITHKEALSFFKKNPQLFSDARLYSDKKIPRSKADFFYKNLFLSTMHHHKDLTVALYHKKNLVGFAVGEMDSFLLKHKIKLAYLTLISISKKHQGQGLSQIVLAHFIHLLSQKADFLEIGTQLSNVRANRLYKRMGFIKKARATALHYWN